MNFMVEGRSMPWVIYHYQIPVRLAFAMTINNAQGQSLNEAGVFTGSCVYTWAAVRDAFKSSKQGWDKYFNEARCTKSDPEYCFH